MSLINAFLSGFQTRSGTGQTWMDDRFFPSLMDMRPTKTGKLIAAEQCLENATVNVCCQILCQGIGVLSRGLYKKRPDEGRDLCSNDPRHKMLARNPNPLHTKMEFEEFMMLQFLLYGNAFAEMIRNGNGRVVEMWPLSSKNMKVARDPNTNQLVYRYKTKTGYKDFNASQIHHRRAWSLDGIVGMSVFEMALNSFSLGLALEEYCCRIFENDATPRGILESANILEKDSKDAIRGAWNKVHQGVENAHKIAILDGGLVFKPMGMTNDLAQYVESRGDQRAEICSWFRVPQHMAGILGRSTNNNIEQQSKEFMFLTLMPHCERIEEALERDILADYERDDYFIEHKLESMLRGDFPEQMQWNTMELQNGIRSINEVRVLKNMNPIPGGDDHYVQVTMQSVETLEENGGQPAMQPGAPGVPAKPALAGARVKVQSPGVSAKTDPEGSEDRAGLGFALPMARDIWTRIRTRDVKAFENCMKRAKTLKDVDDWLKEFLPAQLQFAEQTLTPLFDSIGELRATTRQERISRINQLVNVYEERIRSSLIGITDVSQIGSLIKEREDFFYNYTLTLLEK